MESQRAQMLIWSFGRAEYGEGLFEPVLLD
jgi:hypothetical protein